MDSWDDYSWLTDALGGGGAGDGTPTDTGTPIDFGSLPNAGGDTTGGTSVSTGGPPSSMSGPTMVANGDGTFTDTATGAMYDADGNSLGTLDPNYQDQNINTGGLNGGAGGAEGLSGLFKSLGLSGSDAAGLLSALAALGGGLYSANRTNKATDQTLAGINQAKTDLTGILGPGAGIGGGGSYAPYIGAGTQALGKLGGFNYQPLAPQFGNLSTQGVNALPKQLTLGMMGGGK